MPGTGVLAFTSNEPKLEKVPALSGRGQPQQAWQEKNLSCMCEEIRAVSCPTWGKMICGVKTVHRACSLWVSSHFSHFTATESAEFPASSEPLCIHWLAVRVRELAVHTALLGTAGCLLFHIAHSPPLFVRTLSWKSRTIHPPPASRLPGRRRCHSKKPSLAEIIFFS